MRRQNNHAPHHCGLAEDHRTHDTHRLAHTGRTACTVIIAQNRRSSLIHCIDRCLDKLTHARYNRHNRDVNITAGHREYVVAADRDKAVGQLHDKSGGTETDNIFRIACTLRNFIFPHKAHFQFRFPGQEIQNEHGGKPLRAFYNRDRIQPIPYAQTAPRPADFRRLGSQDHALQF